MPFFTMASVVGAMPNGLYEGHDGTLGICVSYRKERPFEETLLLVPKVLTVGVGCRRGVAKSAIANAIRETFAQNGLDLRAVKKITSITLKSDEEGLLAYCADMNDPVGFYTPEQLAALDGVFTSSEFVRSTVGVDNVCERSASFGGNRIIVKKNARNGVTVAVAEQPWEVEF